MFRATLGHHLYTLETCSSRVFCPKMPACQPGFLTTFGRSRELPEGRGFTGCGKTLWRLALALSAPPRRPARHPSSSEEGSVFNNSPPDSGGVAPWAPGWLYTGESFSAACSAPPKTRQCCHPEPVRCHSERSEESRSAAQGKVRDGSRSEHFQGNARFFLRKAQDRRCSSAETRRVIPWNSAGVARTCFLGPRLVPMDKEKPRT